MAAPDIQAVVHLSEFWTDEFNIPAGSVWRLTQAQSARRWRGRNSAAGANDVLYTLVAAPRALGISGRLMASYEHGERAIPRLVALATRRLHRELAVVSGAAVGS